MKEINLMRCVDLLDEAKKVFSIEAESINNLSSLLTQDFEKVVRCIHVSKGKLIVSGMGKSGIIGKKISATLASTGTPSFFLHPGEAYHGDLGMIEKNDVVLMISNSGETDEVLKLIPFLRHQKNIVISMSGDPDSTLAINSDYHLNIYVEKEACPLQLAPTSSTTATLVMGDALAVSLMKLNDFKDENFAQFHPGGTLGHKLLTTVESVMIKSNLPICHCDSSVKDVVHIINDGKCGLVVVVHNGKLSGVITDGDIRRFMDTHEESFFKLKASALMTKAPLTIHAADKIIAASDIMTNNQIGALVVLDDEDEVVGVILSHQTQLI